MGAPASSKAWQMRTKPQRADSPRALCAGALTNGDWNESSSDGMYWASAPAFTNASTMFKNPRWHASSNGV